MLRLIAIKRTVPLMGVLDYMVSSLISAFVKEGISW